MELRVSTVPTREAEKAVLRILAQSGSQRLDEIGARGLRVLAAAHSNRGENRGGLLGGLGGLTGGDRRF